MEATAESEFARFVERRHRALVRSAFLLTGDRGHAEDLVQTALYRTFGSWSRLRSADAAEAYARTTMVRLALRWRRRRWVGEISIGDLPETGARATDDRIESDLDLWSALGRLSAEQRAVLVLRYLEDLSESETAAVLRCSVGTVKSRASRALAVLRASSQLFDDREAQP